MGKIKSLRNKIEKGELIVGMGAWDVMSAKIIEKAGYDMVWLQSFQQSFGRGVPDMDLVTPSDQLELTWRICGEVDIPVLVDLSYGWGENDHAAYWTREFERAGAAALHIDDKEFERCPFLPGPPIPRTPQEKFVKKLHAVMDASKEDMVILVRGGPLGTDREQTISRFRTYKEEGADVLFVLGRTKEEIQYLRSELDGPLALQARPLSTVTETGEEIPDIATTASFQELYDLGLQILYFWGCFSVAYLAMLDAMVDIKKSGGVGVVQERWMDWDTIKELVGYPRI